MIKKTLYFGNPAYLSLRLEQLVIKSQKTDVGEGSELSTRTIPVEDIGIVVLDHKQITITQAVLEKLLGNNCAVITCDSRHLPVGLLLPLSGHTVQNERFRSQLDASLPLCKQLWQQTVQAKIQNQASVLYYSTGGSHNNMQIWAQQVKSGDTGNMEARAAVYYWKTIFPDNPDFLRGQFEDEPNGLFNYGYAILRAIVARALVMSGMLPTIGIHHHNRYNAYCLADDIMEPYRPYVDRLVLDIISERGELCLSKDAKVKLLSVPVLDVEIDGHVSPLMVAVSTTTSSLAKCFAGELRKVIYPVMS